LDLDSSDDTADPVDQSADALDDLLPPTVEADDPFEAAEDTDAGSDTTPEDSGAAPKTVPYKRLQKVVAERNAHRERLAALEEATEKSNLELVELKAFRDAMSERYKRFRNPAVQLAQDADFMSALEEMAKQDREIHGFYRKVVQFMQTGESRPEPKTPEAPKPDARIDKVLEREARRTVTETLAPLQLQPKFEKLIAGHVLQNAKDLAELSAAQIKKLTREFLTEHDFKLADVQVPKQKDDAAGDKPTTTRASGTPAPAARKTDTKAAEPAKFKSREEYLEHRRSILDNLIADLSR